MENIIKKYLAKWFGSEKNILPRLGKEFDRNYAVEYTKELEKRLSKSGFKILHRGPYSPVRKPYYDIVDCWTVNPYRKTGVVASHSGYVRLTAEEFFKMYKGK